MNQQAPDRIPTAVGGDFEEQAAALGGTDRAPLLDIERTEEESVLVVCLDKFLVGDFPDLVERLEPA